VLNQTQFGRQIYAVGNDAGRRAQGRHQRRLGHRARLRHLRRLRGARRLRADLADRPPRPGFGEGREFDVIAAAVLGGTSLFGGIGSALSAVIGATLIQTSRPASSSPASTSTCSRSCSASSSSPPC
jgi:ABC-type xylose transport system permease subunit